VRSLVESFVRRAGTRTRVAFAVRFAGGGEYRNREEAPVFTLVFRSAAAYARVAAFGHIGLLESYFDGQLDIEGSLAGAMAVGMESGAASNNLLVGVRNRWHELRFSNRDWTQAKKNAESHYALGTEFYRYWLDDPLMMYTCAYWKEGTSTLEEAQRNKIEHVAAKLRLAPRETVVDIGSGFGGFMFHAQHRYGVKVTGINTTTSQVEMVRAEIARRGLGGSLDVIDTDFRDARR
jgi:cyclopropane-fatty-acyl-phospholipid synthase